MSIITKAELIYLV